MASRDTHEGRIAGAASVVGSATVLSRIAGYARDAAIAYVFGAGLAADAFFMAFRIANLLRRLVGEGALTSSFIPIFTEELGLRSREEAKRLLSSIFTLFTLILAALTVLGMVFSKEIVWLMSPGFLSDPVKFDLTVSLTRLMFPYMLFVGLMAVAMGALNSVKHFVAPAISPLFFNIIIILAVLTLTPFLQIPVYALAVGVLIGGLFQFVLQLPYLRRYGLSPTPLFHFKDKAIWKIFLLMGPAAFGVGVYQLNIFVTLWFSSQLAEGSVSYLYYAGRLMELPLGVFGVAIATAALPSLSEHAAKKEWDGFRESLSFALRIVNFVTIPATAGLVILSYPVIDVLFKRGSFNDAALSGTAIALSYYAVGLVPVAVSRILSSVFYSLKDTATPVYVALVSFVVNVVLCFALIKPLGHGGLALATSLSSAVNAVFLLVVLRKRFGRFDGRGIFSSALKSSVASLLMMGTIFVLIRFLYSEPLGMVWKAGILLLAIVSGIVIYIALARIFKSSEVLFLKNYIKSKRP